MRTPAFPLISCLRMTALALAMGAVAASPARASDAQADTHAGAHAAAKTSPAAPAAHRTDSHAQPSPAPAAHAPAPASAAAPAAVGHPPAPPEPAPQAQGRGEPSLEVIRQRLTERLKARPTPTRGTPYDLQIAGNAPSPAPSRRAVARAEPARIVEVAEQPEPPHWSYQGDSGPSAWSRLSPEFSTCATGRRQSPIDIRDGIRVQLDPIRFDYRPSGFSVVDNGHTVMVRVSAGNSIEVMGRRYELQQFHFHRPAEERLDGRSFDMDVHLVHRDPEGRVAVVAILLERGTAQPVVQEVWNNLPLEKNEELAAPRPIDLNGLLPEDRGYYTYMGSLTTPPCSEGVLWMVMRKPQQTSPDQIAVFSRLYPMNARPIQSSAGRLIKGSE